MMSENKKLSLAQIKRSDLLDRLQLSNEMFHGVGEKIADIVESLSDICHSVSVTQCGRLNYINGQNDEGLLRTTETTTDSLLSMEIHIKWQSDVHGMIDSMNSILHQIYETKTSMLICLHV